MSLLPHLFLVLMMKMELVVVEMPQLRQVVFGVKCYQEKPSFSPLVLWKVEIGIWSSLLAEAGSPSDPRRKPNTFSDSQTVS